MCDHDAVAHEPATSRARRSPAAAKQLYHVRARRTQSRDDAETRGGQQCSQGGESKRMKIDVCRIDARDLCRNKSVKHVDDCPRQAKSQQSAGRREKDRFRENLAHEKSSTRPERRTHGEFVFTRRGAQEEKIRDVRASDQQQQYHSAHQDEDVRTKLRDNGFMP